MSKRRIYLDHNATTPLHPEVKKAIQRGLEVFGNPSSMHQYGRQARKIIEDAREEVAQFIGAVPEELVFVGSGSEANNTVLSTLMCTSPHCMHTKLSCRGVLTTQIEHPCVFETAKCLQDRGLDVTFLKVDRYGKIDIDQLRQVLAGGKIGIVSVMTANNEIGTLQDIKTIAKIVHDHGVLFHTDAVQAVGKVPIDVKDLDIDFLTLSAHKIYGPKGIGALYVKKGVRFCPFIRGGHQERGRRAGTENTIGIIGFGKAIAMRKLEMVREEKRLREFQAMLKDGLKKKISNIQFNGHPEDCLANTVNVSFEGAEGETILLYLDLEGIAVSTGSACASGSLDPSHVLLAAGVTPEHAHGSIRISMGRATTKQDIEYVLEVMPRVIERVRSMSTTYTKKGS